MTRLRRKVDRDQHEKRLEADFCMGEVSRNRCAAFLNCRTIAITLTLVQFGLIQGCRAAISASDHIQIVGGGFERLLGVMMRNKSGVVIKGDVALPAETIKGSQQTGVFLVDTPSKW
jgi:hypothetical protein